MIPYPLSVVVTTEPTSEPVTLAEAKAHCRATDLTDDDTYISALIKTARETAEKSTQRRLMTTILAARYENWPGAYNATEFWLPGPPLASVQSVAYIDADGNMQTWGSSNYIVDIYSAPGRLKAANGVSYPGLGPGQFNPITIAYTAGYASAGAVPQSIKEGIMLLVGLWYGAREDAGTVQLKPIPMGAQRLFNQCKVAWGYTHQ